MSKLCFVVLALGLIGTACSGGSDDEDNGGDCSCSCACCVSLGNCDTPSDIAASDSSDCNEKCEGRCGLNFSSSYECG